MPYKVAIRKNETDEIRVVPIDVDWDDNSEFWWTEGNMGCDCNRENEFYRGDDDGPDFDELKCSEGRYSALYDELEDGTKIKIDEDKS